MRLGIVGGGQLGRMLAMAAYPLGLRVRVIEPKHNSSAGQVAHQVDGEYDDREALERFVDGCDVVTYEFENVPVDAARELAGRLPVHPDPRALEKAQDRLVEKGNFQDLTIPTITFAPADDAAGLRRALERVGTPAVAKTRRWGYDGKGQRMVDSPDDAERVWEELGGRPLIVEGFVDFDRELSIIAVRGRDGAMVFYPLVENRHSDGILRRSAAPAPDVPERMQKEAEEYARRVMEALDYVGVLTIEWFEIGGALLANEMAPRVHNSGHYSIDGARTSQFENHVRAVCGLPLGDPGPRAHSVMVNLIGSHPPVERMLEVPGARIHLYGKSARPGRKIGHVTFVGDDAWEVGRRADRLEKLLREESPAV